MEFEWNPDKAKLNGEKHNVSFEEAARVYQRKHTITKRFKAA
jgi:uncharacterized protein